MLKRTLKSIFYSFGYELKRRWPVDESGGYELYQYRKPDGTFDYEKYRQVQTAGNKEKINKVWVQEENVAFLARYISSHLAEVKFGLCHGTRRGKEQEWFGKYLNCEVLGTEISDTATDFPNTIQWDFHDVKPEWIESVDFIYSNSFDHSYDPPKCLDAWMSCVKRGGFCILEHTSDHEHATELDPFGADLPRMPYLILRWGQGRYCVRELLKAPSTPDELTHIHYLVIQKL